MKYPEQIWEKAEAVLSERRQYAFAQQALELQKLWKEHPEIDKAQKSINSLSAQLGKAILCGDTANKKSLADALTAERERLHNMMYAANLTETRFRPSFTCNVCQDKGMAAGKVCQCRQTLLNELVYEQLCDISPAGMCTFESFELRYYSDAHRAQMGKVVEACRRYGEKFSPQSPSLLFTGATGLGKTHLSVSIASLVARLGYFVMYVSAPHLADQLERGKFKHDAAAQEYRELLYSGDLLIIDDLGAELVTRYTQAELDQLVDTRLRTQHPTIINTNLNLAEIEKLYTGPMCSRLAGKYITVLFQGRDIRIQKKLETT